MKGAALAEELGPRASFVHPDVTKPEEWDKAVAHADWDYDEYWSYVSRIANGIVANGLRPAICGVGLPEQVIPAAEAAGSLTVSRQTSGH